MAKGKNKIYIMMCGQFNETKKKNWLETMPEVTIMGDIELVEILDKPSVNITSADWTNLANQIYTRLDSAAGFVILHNTDNLLYTANALNFLIQNLSKPIVITGGSFHASQIDFKANLINAIQVVSSQFTEVGLVFGNRLIRASNADRDNTGSSNLFSVPESAVLGRIDFSVRIFDKSATKNKGATKLYQKLNNNLKVINISPLLDLKVLAKEIQGKSGIVIKARNYEALPQDLLFILQTVVAEVPVMVWSKKMPATALMPTNLMVVNNMTWPAALVKFAWALEQSDDIKKIRSLIEQDIAKEIMDK